MRSGLGPILLVLVAASLALFAYVAIRPALFVVILSNMALAGFYACASPRTQRLIGRTPILLATGLPLAAWLMTSAALLYLCMLAAVPLLARRPGEAAPLYLFALLLLPGLDQTITIGSLKLFEFGVHDALVLGATLCLALRPGRARIPMSLDGPCIAVLLVLVIATARDTSITNFFRVLINGTLDCGLPYYVVSRSLRTSGDLKLCLVYLAAAATILSVILVYEARSSWPIYNILYDHYRIPMQLMVKARGGVLRAGGPFLESTSIAMVLTSCLLATWLHAAAFRSRFHHCMVLAVLFAGLIAPQSRGAWIGLLIGIAAADLYRGRIGAAARRFAVIGALGAALFAVAPASPFLSETLGLSGGSADTVDYRQRLLERGMEEFWHSPITGYSSPEVLVHLADLRQGEGIVDFVNTYIYFALLSGMIGLLIFIGAFVSYLARLYRLRRRFGRDDPDGNVVALVFAGLIIPMEMLFFTSFGGRPEVFVFVFYAFAASTVAFYRRTAPAARAARAVPRFWQDDQTSGSRIAHAP